MREAGACQVALSSPRRFALMRELGDAPEMSFADILPYAGPCDLVLVEGYKREAFPRSKSAATAPPRASLCRATSRRSWRLPRIVLRSEDGALPVFDLDDVKGIADFIVATVGLKPT